ncbi:MAG: type II secretion system F family protein [Lachnospiraceae bacterium]|nr:type II secretion system F family protein [Lachnospiraceae bacterium]
MAQKKTPFTGMALSGFCMQVSLLYQAAVPLYEGLSVMAEDAHSDEEKAILTEMANNLRMGYSFSETIKKANCFPSYTEEMIFLGEQTGTLDVTLNGLASHYEKEHKLVEGLRRTLTYPAMMVCMLLVILFVLFVKIMPVFTDVYEQLGASIPPITQAAIRLGGIVSGAALIVIALLAVFVLFVKVSGDSGKRPAFVESILTSITKKSQISQMTALRRFCSIISVTLRCGLRTDQGFELAERMVEHPNVEAQIKIARKAIMEGTTFYDAVKNAGLFNGFDLQLIRVASRAGRLDTILSKIADDYDEKTSEALDAMVARIEPIIVTVLAVAVGLVLLSVMLPLAGVLSAIG